MPETGIQYANQTKSGIKRGKYFEEQSADI